MNFEQRSYNSEVFRPKPEVHFDPESRILIVATPWGSPSSARKAIQSVLDYLVTSGSDQEATTPFKRLTCLSPLANSLRIATLLANELLYREDNRDEYVGGVELFAAKMTDQELVYVQVGHPNLVLFREGRTAQPISVQVDLGLDLSQKKAPVAPLPGQLLGPDSSCNLSVQSFRPQKNDQLALISRSNLPPKLFQVEGAVSDLSKISKVFAKDHPSMPFWLGLWSFS
jgi:hypothetical protein